MKLWTLVGASIVFAAVAACGGPKGTSEFSDCEESRWCEEDGMCTLVEDCFLDRCEWERTYRFAGDDYESTCVYGPETKTTEYPLEGGPGTKRVERDVQTCFYKTEVRWYSFDEVGTCTVDQSCTVQDLECAPARNGRPDCRKVSQAPCRDGLVRSEDQADPSRAR